MSTNKALDEVLGEFGMFVTRELAATQIAIACLRTVAHQALETFRETDDQDETRILGTGVPGGGWIAPVHGMAGAKALVAEMGEGGGTHCRLTQQWIVTVYTAWDAEYRARVAAAHGVPVKGISADFFGDLRWLRNDIVHHQGTATPEGSARCRTVLSRILAPGDVIFLSDEELRRMHLLVPWPVLVKKPMSL